MQLRSPSEAADTGVYMKCDIEEGDDHLPMNFSSTSIETYGSMS